MAQESHTLGINPPLEGGSKPPERSDGGFGEGSVIYTDPLPKSAALTLADFDLPSRGRLNGVLGRRGDQRKGEEQRPIWV